jgi:serum/glucocorticoid-regulated kinase 2
MDDFERLKVIGKGTFGKVYLVRKITDDKIYAMKSIRKDIMIENDQIESAKMEKQILLTNQHPFLVKMSYVFQDDQKVYFVMNFIRGGELFTHLNNEKRFPEDKARFYAIQIMLSLGYLHKQDIVYRDIKPENILIGDDGYLFLADFGLAKNIKKGQKATTFCGTPEYLAPEIIREEGHNHAVDWWACGILIYEMIVGFPPFYHKNQKTMYDLIEKFPVKFPDPVKHGIQMSEDAKDLIEKLLEKDPKKRIGYEGGFEEIIAHNWFKCIDIDMLLNKQLDAPFVPDLSDELTDVTNFDELFTLSPLVDSFIPKANMKAVDKHKTKFSDF